MKRQSEEGRRAADTGTGSTACGSGHGDRFFIDSLPAGEGEFELSGAEALHAAGSRRLRVGDSAVLFDGSGWDVRARIVEASSKRLILAPASRSYAGPPTCVPVVCATALPKGEREDVLVAKCAELGVSRIVPVDFERCVVHAAAHWEKRSARFRRLAIEAAKQSGASTVMEVAPPVAFAEFISASAKGARLIGIPRAESGVIDALSGAWPAEEVAFLVGPEGGITDAETAAATAAGFRPVRLGATILRVETACIAFASIAAAFLSKRKDRL